MDRPVRPPRVERAPPKFVTGPLLTHILVMTGAGGLGLVAIFLGDLANMVFLSWLRDEAVVAAVGYASSILFFTTSIGIGLSIAATSLVSPALGAGLTVKARRLSVNAHLTTFAASIVLAALVWIAIPYLLTLIGAEGRAHDLATSYLEILVPGLPPLAVAMTSMSVLRSVGDARRAMLVTLCGALVNVILDPIMIFGLGLGIDGAAIASLISRLVIVGVAVGGVVRVHNLMGRPRLRPFLADAPALMKVAVPAILTNVATPVSNAYVTAAIAPYGDSAVAGWAIVGRIMPVVFGLIYALSGSIGPIIGQNYGARNDERMRHAVTLSLAVTAAFTAIAWLVLAVLAEPLVHLFHATGDAAELIAFYCRYLAPLFFFFGAMFVANATFNTLGRPHFSTAINWARATLGTIPFVEAGSAMAGAKGIVAGYMVGAIAFGAIAVWLCYRHMDDIARRPTG